ncbi:hypothetical protein MUN89_18590 [Halobacillus salinarum]|uniref:Voltage-gated potassium channel n=1 Tax=Halobacillus salinarum TaxID=2932257 RepID=A0ABY4EHF0_9BACI|nr:hypothetical protein [Halobacillus salinarum]UOQ43860.1 hypothetical protein MUN89_18590 [Halobacillus salinarum]
MKLINRKPSKTLYELFMVCLAGLSVATIWKNTNYDGYIVWTTWTIFFIDFLYRFFKSKNKWTFVKKNPFIVIAAIPLDAVFQFARFARILHLLRLKSITRYYTKPFIRFLRKQHLSLVASFTFFLVFLLIIPLKLMEENLNSYHEAWKCAVTSLTFFGRTGFEPETAGGQIIIVIFSILGVVIHGLIISTTIDYLFRAPAAQQFIQKFKNIFSS